MFDSHAHYTEPDFDADRESILRKVRENGIEHILNVSYDKASSEQSVLLAERQEGVYAAAGVHPLYCDRADVQGEAWLRTMIRSGALTALGEFGLDYYNEKKRHGTAYPSRARQWECFDMQMKLCAQSGLPAVLHSRAAAQDTVRMLQSYPMVRGVLHGFSYSGEVALACVRLGWYIGIGTALTRANARRICEVVQVVPMEHLLIETDCPFQTTESRRGQRGDSRMLMEIAERIALLKNIPYEEAAHTAAENAAKLFRIGGR